MDGMWGRARGAERSGRSRGIMWRRFKMRDGNN